jgi:hypothetical protein
MAGILLFLIPWAWTYPFPRIMLAMMIGAAVTMGAVEVLIRVAGERTAVYGTILAAIIAIILVFAPFWTGAEGILRESSWHSFVRGALFASIPAAFGLTQERGRGARSGPSWRAFFVSGGTTVGVLVFGVGLYLALLGRT